MIKDYGKIARAKRKKLGLTQKQVAKMAGCHTHTITMFELNKRVIGFDIVLDIFDALGLQIDIREVGHDRADEHI